MIGIGWMEMMILLIAVIVFLKPEEIPRFFRMLGRFYAQVFGIYQQVARQINLSDVEFSRKEGRLPKEEKNDNDNDNEKNKIKKSTVKSKKSIVNLKKKNSSNAVGWKSGQKSKMNIEKKQPK